MSNVSIALIGSGFVAEFYMQGLANVPGHKVVANYSQGGERARQFAGRWSIAESTTDLEKLIGRRDIDLYIIALPNQVHLPVSLELSRAKKNQVCTKPLGRTRQEAKAMWDAAARSDALHGYAETEVFAPCVVKARQMIEQVGVARVLGVRSL
jgi:predicted dehydrogenase